MPSYPTHRSKHTLNQQRGVSLVELMISLTIGMVLLLGITTLIVQQSKTRDELEKSSRQIENGRYAMQILHDTIEHAGYYGYYSPSTAVTATAFDPCASWNLGWGTSPIKAATPFGTTTALPLTCLPNYLAGTDVLVVRRVDTSVTPLSSATAGVTYLQVSQCAQEASTTPFALASAGFTLHKKDCATLADLNQYYVRIYYVSSCDMVDVSNNCTDTTPTLKMVENNGTPTPLAEGIENLQLDYGLDTDFDGYPDGNYIKTPATAADWANVVTVRVNLLARNTECTTGYTDTKTYNLGLTGAAPAPASTGCINGAYKRHVFSELVRAINPSGRRAQQ